jgi:glycosyltransferase involved in cell wall biosynthesis
VRRGDQVTVVTGLPHYPDWGIAPGLRRAIWSEATVEGVHIIHAAHYVPSVQSAVRRAVYEGTFGLTALLAAMSVPRPDVIVGIVPSLSGGLVARMTAARLRAPYGILFQDLMGPSARDSGVPGGERVADATVAAEKWAVRRASAVGVVTHAFVPYLESLGVHRAVIHLVPNWSRLAEPTLTVEETRKRFGWTDGRAVVLHAGNMGYKQGLEQVVDAARLAAARCEPVQFVLAGGGNRAGSIRAAIGDLSNVTFIGVQPNGIHASLLAAADVLLLSELPTQIQMSLPSKLTSYFAAGRPIVAAVPVGGSSAAEIERSGAGVVVPAGQPEALMATVQSVLADREHAARLGAAGSAYAATNTSSAICLERAENFVDAITEHPFGHRTATGR